MPIAFEEYLVEILLGIILLFNTTSFKILWDKVHSNEEEIEKNTETLSMLLNRVFGIDEDPTDKGYIMETENRLEEFSEQLESIAEKQDEACQSRERMEKNIYSIMKVLENEEKIDIEKSDFER